MAYIDDNSKMYDIKFSEGWGSYYPSSELITFYHRYIKNKMPKNRKLKVLDFGCGRGSNLGFFLDMGYDVYGIDISNEAIKICKDNFRFDPNNFVQADVVRDKPIDEIFDCKFDIIVATVSLTYLGRSDIRNVIQQFSKVMNDSGVVIASFFEKQPSFDGELDEEGMINTVISNLDINHYIFILKDKNELRELFSGLLEITIGETKTVFPDYEIMYTYYIGQMK